MCKTNEMLAKSAKTNDKIFSDPAFCLKSARFCPADPLKVRRPDRSK